MEWNIENQPAVLVEVKKGAKLKGFLMFSAEDIIAWERER